VPNGVRLAGPRAFDILELWKAVNRLYLMLDSFNTLYMLDFALCTESNIKGLLVGKTVFLGSIIDSALHMSIIEAPAPIP